MVKAKKEIEAKKLVSALKQLNIYRLLHRKCFVRIFIHSLQDFGKLTRSLQLTRSFCKVLQLVNKNPYKALSML